MRQASQQIEKTMYTETEKDSHIWDVRGEEGYQDGWYFSDETEQWNGPYATQIEAAGALASYCDWLDQGRDVNEAPV